MKLRPILEFPRPGVFAGGLECLGITEVKRISRAFDVRERRVHPIQCCEAFADAMLSSLAGKGETKIREVLPRFASLERTRDCRGIFARRL